MSGDKSKELLEEFSKVDDPVRRSQISYSIFARVAAGLENREGGYEKVKISKNGCAAMARRCWVKMNLESIF